MHTDFIDYQESGDILQGFFAYNNQTQDQRPVVIIAHDWSGQSTFTEDKAMLLAEWGYIGFAIDLFGKGVRGETKEEKSQLIEPFMQDRHKLQTRLLAGFDEAKNLPHADKKNIAAIGFCFGGLCVLDLARSGVDVKGVVSLHGLLKPTGLNDTAPINARILALHGFEDPMVTPEEVMHFGEEMTDRKADWEIDIYGQTMHAFTNPKANDPDFGTVYHPRTSQRALQRTQLFLAECFQKT